jgi:hypothetical protein
MFPKQSKLTARGKPRKRRFRWTPKLRANYDRMRCVYANRPVTPAAIRQRKCRARRRALLAACAKAERSARWAYRWWLKRRRIASGTTKADLARKAQEQFVASIATEWYAPALTRDEARAFVASTVVPNQREATDACIHIARNECQQTGLALNRTTLARNGVWEAQKRRALLHLAMQQGGLEIVPALAVAASKGICDMPSDKASLFTLLQAAQAALGDGRVVRDVLSDNGISVR